MIFESITIGFIVMVLGLLSLTLVTGTPLGQAFSNTQMMGVFFVTGVLLTLLCYMILLGATCAQCKSKECYCGKEHYMGPDGKCPCGREDCPYRN